MREVEAQAIWCHERASLAHVIAEDLLERCIQKVRGRMVPADELTSIVVHDRIDRITHPQLTRHHIGYVCHKLTLMMLRIGHDKLCGLADEPAGIAYLATHLAIEARPIEDDLSPLPRHRTGDLAAVRIHHGEHFGAAADIRVVALEERLGKLVRKAHPDARSLTPRVPVRARPSTLSLRRHLAVKGLHVDTVSCALADLAREVDRKAIGIMQLEGKLTRQVSTRSKFRELRPQACLARVERRAKALLLGQDDAIYQRLVIRQLGIDVGHEAYDLMTVAGKEAASDAHEPAVVDRAAQQTAQDVATTLIGG